MISVTENQMHHPSYRDHEKQAPTKIESTLLMVCEGIQSPGLAAHKTVYIIVIITEEAAKPRKLNGGHGPRVPGPPLRPGMMRALRATRPW
jgi:hypothetical protein